MRILKFGGSSLATADCIRQTGKIVLLRASRETTVVVVSAFQAITNQLLECARLAENGAQWKKAWRTIVDQHRAVIDILGGALVVFSGRQNCFAAICTMRRTACNYSATRRPGRSISSRVLGRDCLPQ